jgi:4-amino-4-deoxy-L-arabinose transferase-like glycosyltransferase
MMSHWVERPSIHADAPSPAAPGCPGDSRFVLGATAITILAFLLRVYRIGRLELWLDEAYSFLLATTPEWFGLATLSNNTPPLYHFLLRGWMALAGDSEAGMRLLSALFGTGFVAVVIWGGRALFTPTVGLWSGGVAAVSPLHVFYSQEARAYALLVLTLMLTYALLARALRQNTWRAWGLVSGAAALALYSHPVAVLGLLPTVLLLWAQAPDQPTGRRWLRYGAAMFGACLLYLPWLLASTLLAHHGTENPFAPWMKQNWQITPPALAIPKSLEVLGLGAQAGLHPAVIKQFRSLDFPQEVRLLGLILLAGLGLVAAVPWFDTRVGVPGLWKRKVWLWVSLFFPLVVLWLVSALIRPIYIVGRYDIVALPAYTLLCGVALTKLHRMPVVGPGLATIVVVAMGVTVGTKLVRYYAVPSQPFGQESAAFLDTSIDNGDVVVFSGDQWFPVLYYLHRRGYDWHDGVCEHRAAARRFACRLFPTEVERTLVSTSLEIASTLEVIQADVEQVIASLSGSPSTLWVAFNFLGGVAEGTLTLTRLDALLARELAHEGFHQTRASERFPELYRFQRPRAVP